MGERERGRGGGGERCDTITFHAYSNISIVHRYCGTVMIFHYMIFYTVHYNVLKQTFTLVFSVLFFIYVDKIV